jgi:hypothetical protein
MTDFQTLDQSGDERHWARDQSLRGRRPPAQIPGYKIERFLGAGAYGEVWTAVDRRTGRTVAVKFYSHRGGLDWSLLSREVEKLTFLFNDRYVVQLIDVGWEADPPYYIMEFLEHGSLEDRLTRGTLPLTDALAIFRGVAIGLVHSHSKGVLHCDLKPGNVLLDQDGHPRLADFGQSRFSQEQAPALGTLFYMAPEQADLKALPDAAWDVYALGALLYRMLVGRPPYRTDAAVQQLQAIPDLESRLTAYREHILRSPRPTAHRQVHGVDRNLAEIIDRCLSPHPHRRYPNVQAVLDDLGQRNVRRARRPLLILGAIGPAILLCVATLFGYSAFDVAVAESDQAVTRRALESSHFAAQFVAERVAQRVHRRWDALHDLADDPDFQTLLAQATGLPRDAPQRQELQDDLARSRRRYQFHSSDSDANWFVTDLQGAQIARAPLDEKTIDRNFAYRDYFHGQGQDFDSSRTDLPPIQQPHRSIVFLSRATNSRMVAFTVPVWNTDDDEDPDRHVIGVLGMTVELGHFAELEDTDRVDYQQNAALIDLRADSSGRKGSLLEHPAFHAKDGAAAQLENAYYLDDELVRRLDHARQLTLRRAALQLDARDKISDGLDATDENYEISQLTAELRQLGTYDDYTDPIGDQFSGRWLAVMQPVIASEESEDLRDVGWAIIIQEPHRAAVEPVRQLARLLVRRGLIALGAVLALLTAMWGFVILLLSESPRSGWLARLRQRTGLATETLGGGTASVTPTPEAVSDPQSLVAGPRDPA